MNREEALALAERGVEELIASLERGKSERLLEYLAFQAKFHRYSFNNCLLIAIQKPDATFVAGSQRWKELGRFVRKGEKGIMILAPLMKRTRREEIAAPESGDQESSPRFVGFRATYVFDGDLPSSVNRVSMVIFGRAMDATRAGFFVYESHGHANAASDLVTVAAAETSLDVRVV